MDSFKYSNITVSGELNNEFAPDRACRVHEIRMHADGSLTSGEYAATIDSVSGAAYDHKLIEQAASALENHRGAYSPPVHLLNGDKIIFTTPNPSSRLIGIQVVWVEV